MNEAGQGLLFELPKPEPQPMGKYWIPESQDVDPPLCWDCKHWPQDMNNLGTRRCKVAKIEVDYRGTCGSHEFRSYEVKAQADEWRNQFIKATGQNTRRSN